MGSVIFDPDGGSRCPNIAEVECLLGGIGTLCFSDGTMQFAEYKAYPDVVYSPRLTEEDLEVFCKQNMAQYEAYYRANSEKIDAYEEAPPIKMFW